MREIHFTLKVRASETTPKRTCVAPMKTARGEIVPAGCGLAVHKADRRTAWRGVETGH